MNIWNLIVIKPNGLINFSKYSEYFYIPAYEGYGNTKYIVDDSGHALYLINKSGLPDEIKKQLVGGDAGEGTYSDYASLNDVYGVTGDLQVYYCSNGLDSISGITLADLDSDNPLREVFSSANNSDYYSLLSNFDTDGDGIISAEEVKSIKTLTITSDSNITSLKDLYALTSLTELTLDNVTLKSLDGIQNAVRLNYLCFTNYTTDKIQDYSAISDTTKLKYLYVTYSCDTQISNLFSAMSETDYNSLLYLGVYYGYDNVSDISSLSKLTTTTKQKIKYMYLYYNYGVQDITCLSGFTNIIILNLQHCTSLTSLSPLNTITSLETLYIDYCEVLTSLYGISNLSKLKYLYASYCDLGAGESYDLTVENNGKNSTTDSLVALQNKSALVYLDLKYNTNLKWISYISGDTAITTLYLEGCTSIISEDIVAIRSLIKSNTTYPPKYALVLLDSKTDTLDLKGETLYLSVFNSFSQYTAIKYLRLNGVTFTDENGTEITDSSTINSSINTVLSSLTNLIAVDLTGISELSDITFVKSTSSLQELILYDTSVTTGTKDSNENYIGLELLEDNCENLKNLNINNSTIDCTQIQKTISKCNGTSRIKYCYKPGYDNTSNYIACGFYCYNQTALNTLSKCTELTQFTITSHAGFYFDLSNCVNIQNIQIYFTSGGSIKLPNYGNYSCIFTDVYDGSIVDGAGCSSIKLSYIYCTTNENFWELFDGMVGASSQLTEFILVNSTKNGSKIVNLSGISKFSSCTKLKSLQLTGSNYSTALEHDLSVLNKLTYLESIYLYRIYNDANLDFSSLENLIELSIKDSKINNISNLKLNNSITYLNLQDNSISSLKNIENCTKLVELNLTNNALYETSSYKDSNGDTITYSNIDILENLNTNGSLQKLYLSGNLIGDYGNLPNLTWTGHSGW